MAVEAPGSGIFGRALSSDDATSLGRSLISAGEHLQTRVSGMKMFIPDWLPTPGNRATAAAVRRLDDVVGEIVRQRRQSNEQHTDLLALLMAAKDEDGRRLSARQLRDAVATLMIAGHETTAFTLTWALHLLSRDPAADAALSAELADVLTDGRAPTLDDVPRLRYTTAVVAETLRLYPAGFVTARETADVVAVDEQVIPKGTLVLASQWVRHRDPAVFDEPEAFRPERWTDEFERSLRRGDYFPFGMGPRQCIGQSFARLELVLVLAALRQRHRFTPMSGDVRPVPIIALQPDKPIHFRLAPSRAA